MAYQDDRMNQIQAQMMHLDNLKRQLREREKSLDARKLYLDQPQTFAASSVKTLKSSLLQNLPNYMMPGNVGGLNEVTWPFYFQLEVDFGQDPIISSSIIKKSFYQVDQEAAFLMMSIIRSHSTDAAGASATINAPLQVDIIDRQSSRRFSDKPIPLQMFGIDSVPSVMPTPMYVQPNAFIDVSVSGITDQELEFTGSGKFQLSFFGYRIRTDDAGKVLSTIFTNYAG